MIETTTYKALDGKVFCDKEECIEYESALKGKRSTEYLFENCVELLGKSYKLVAKNPNCDFPNETEYIRFKRVSNEEREKLKLFLETHFGIDIVGDSDDDLYYYDEEECRFQSLSYKIKDLKERLDEYEEIKKQIGTLRSGGKIE